MCNFLSAIAYRDGSIFADPEHTDSHSDLKEHLGLKDDQAPMLRNWVAVEYTPENRETSADVTSYTLRLDEPGAAPGWWDDVKGGIELKCRTLIQSMIVTDKRGLLLGGCWILAEGADVHHTVAAKIAAMSGSSKVGAMYDSSKVGAMYGSSKVGAMYDSSKVGAMSGSSKVGAMYDSSKAPRDPRIKADVEATP